MTVLLGNNFLLLEIDGKLHIKCQEMLVLPGFMAKLGIFGLVWLEFYHMQVPGKAF